jgi:ribosomal subunit interface protein
MLVKIASGTLPLTKALREFAQTQAERLKKLNQPVSKVSIFLDKQVRSSKQNSKALVKFVVSVPGKTIVIRKATNDMYEAISAATLRAIRGVRKLKEKRIARHRDPH